MKNPNVHRRIVQHLYDDVRKDPILKEKVENMIGGEIYKFLDDLVPETNPTIVVVIDSKSKEVEEACNALPAPTRIVEFRTFVRENIGDLRVHAHLFESVFRKIKEGVYPPRVKEPSAKGKITPQKEYRIPILETLIEFGGRGEVKDVLESVKEKMKDRLTDSDLERLASGYDVRWRNHAMWERMKMINEGLLKKNSPRGYWEISDEGHKYYENRSKS